MKKLIQVGVLGVVSLFSTYAAADWSFPLFDFSSFSSSSPELDSQARTLSAKAPSLNPEALKLGLKAYHKAREQGLDNKQLLTIVDYSKPSTERRLYVFDMKQNNVLFHEYVAHGKNSGDNLPTSFSNSPSSLKSSLGVYVTRQPYVGSHGYSLRINGLEKGINDMAARRAIVVHAANYVSDEVAKTYGRLGRTWGCFGISTRVAHSVIDTIKGGTVIFAYAPSRSYISHSQFVG